jgi:predicted transcriptional regulator
MADETLLDHVADIVSAHVSNNSVSASDLPGLIQSVYASLAVLGQAPEPARGKAHSGGVGPRVGQARCGDLPRLRREVQDAQAAPWHRAWADAGRLPRTRWNLPADYPMVASDYAETRKALALKIGLGRKPKAVAASASEPAKPAKVSQAAQEAGASPSTNPEAHLTYINTIVSFMLFQWFDGIRLSIVFRSIIWTIKGVGSVRRRRRLTSYSLDRNPIAA